MKFMYVILSFIMLISACNSNCVAPSSPAPDKDEEQSSDVNIGSIVDLVLIYGGSAHRNVIWNADHFTPYVSYINRTNQEHWLFDGFLLLDYIDGKGKIFATGYYGTPATKNEWDALIDYFFTPGQSVDALNKCIEDDISRLGNPPYKRKVIIVLPEPIVAGPGSDYKDTPADYWGTLDNRKLNFTNQEDRIAACNYYIDRVKSKFNEGKFRNLELAGFYWLAEESLHTKSILLPVSEHLTDEGFDFYWIPYWKTNPDYLQWEELGFNAVYLQPNYFFNAQVPYSRLENACKVAIDYNLDLEMEFDLTVLVNNGNLSTRLYDYMRAFRENGILPEKRIAYYQDCDAVYQLYRSSDERDKVIFYDFCDFVLEHQTAYIKNKQESLKSDNE